MASPYQVAEREANYTADLEDPKLVCQVLVRITEEEQADMDTLRLIKGIKINKKTGQPDVMTRSEYLREALRFRINFTRMVQAGYFDLRTALPFSPSGACIRQTSNRIHGSKGAA